MRRTLVAIATVAALSLSGCAWIRQADVSRTGGDANQITGGYLLSANGRYVYVDTGATNLVDETAGIGPAENFRGIFRRDNKTEKTVLLRRNASVLTDDAGVSRDLQRLLIFDSSRTGLQLWDRAAGTVSRVDVDSVEHPIGATPSSTVDATISADGRSVAFRVTGPAGLGTYVRDLAAGTTHLVTNTPQDPSTNSYIYLSGFDAFSLSDDGSVLSVSTCLESEFVHGTPDCRRWGLELVDVELDTVSRPLAEQPTPFGARLSGDGRILAYSDGVAVRTRNRLTGATQAVSVDRNGRPVGGGEASISTNGRYVTFSSGSPNLVDADLGFNKTHVYVRDRAAGTTVLASAEQDGTPMRDGGFQPVISADGRYVTFRHFSLSTSTDPTIHWGVSTKAVAIPHIANVLPPAAAPGTTVHVTVAGFGFRPDANVSFGHAGVPLPIVVHEVQPGFITLDVTVPGSTASAPFDVTVGNPGSGPGFYGGAADSCAGCFLVRP